MLLKIKKGSKIAVSAVNRETGALEQREMPVLARTFTRDTAKVAETVTLTAEPVEVPEDWATEILARDATVTAVDPPTADEKAEAKAEAKAEKAKEKADKE